MPEITLEVWAGGAKIPEGAGAEVPGRGDLRVRSGGHTPGELVEIGIGGRLAEVRADAEGEIEWVGPGLLGQVAGEVRVVVGARELTFSVRPEKLVAEAIVALVTELEAAGEGLAQDAAGVGTQRVVRSREHELLALDVAVGLAGSAAPGIRRRPIHRAREVVRAVPSDVGPRRAADVRWLATHPVQAVRAAATGRAVRVVRERRADLDTLENRGVLAAYDQLEVAVAGLRAAADGEIGRLEGGRAARERFLTERGNLWVERDQPRYEALVRRRDRLDALRDEVLATRVRSGLPDLRPRATRMVRTARVDAEPAYWSTFRAFQMAERAVAGDTTPAPAPVRALDELWEQWCTVALVRAITEVLGPQAGGGLVDPGWFATLRRGPVARWRQPRREVTVLYEPEYAYHSEGVRKLHAGRPWRPDLVVDVRWVDGTRDLHVFDAKYRLEGGGPPWGALREIWWKYGEHIGDEAGMPVVRSVWAIAPCEGVATVGPGMLREAWPIERLRGGVIGARPGREVRALWETVAVLLGSE